MKIHVPTLLCSLLLGAATVVQAGSVPALDVTVLNPAGKVAYKAKTGPNGTFSTGKLEPGNYTVQFNSNSAAAKGSQFAIVVSAGKKKVSADAVAGDKFSKGGVAMKVDVGAGLNITGQVVTGQIAGAAGAGGGNAKTKMMNGKKYIWVGPETGSHMGGHWVEESMANAPNSNMDRSGADALQGMQDRGQGGAVPGGG